MTYDINTPSVARLWRFEPDFTATVDLRRSFLTDITASRNNTERRRALRATPRRSQSYRVSLIGDDLQAAGHFLRAWQNKPTAVPDFTRWAATTGSSAGGASTLTMTSPPVWAAAGQLAILCGPDGDRELVEIESVAAPTITLTDPLASAWPSGSILRPAFFGLLSAQMRADIMTRGAQQVSVQISAYPGSEPPEDEGSASTSFNGYEVFTAEPDFAQHPAIDYVWPVEQVDFGYGRSAQFRPIDSAAALIEATFTGLSPSAAEEIEQFFLRHKGMRGAFYRPTGQKDMTLAADSTAPYFDAVGTDLADYFGAIDFAENPTAIEIVQTNGTRTHKLITGIDEISGNSRVSFAGSISLSTSSTARISWMPLVRFASDELITSWRTFLSASIRTTFQTLRHPVEIETSYAYFMGSGERSHFISISASFLMGSGGGNDLLINGSQSNALWWTTRVGDGTHWLIFDFGTEQIIDEFKWYQDQTYSHGAWRFEGSDDAATWVQVGSDFTLTGSVAGTAHSVPNTTAYRYYRLRHMSGTRSLIPWLREIEFKINQGPGTSYGHPGGYGDRTSSITISTVNIATGGGSIATLIDGAIGNGYFWSSTAGNGTAWVLFDFGVGVTKLIDEFRWDQGNTNAHGTWRFEGSDDNSTWTQCGADFTLGGASGPVKYPVSNSTAYRYYRLRHMSGTRSAGPYLREIEFKISE